MMDQSRRDSSREAGEAAIVASVSTTSTSSPKADFIPASEWDYSSINQLTEALQARKISASERHRGPRGER